MLVNTVDDHRPIITRATHYILPSASTRYRVVSEIAIIVCEERRNSPIDKALYQIIIINNSRGNKAWCCVEDILKNEAGNLRWRHSTWFDVGRDEIA